MFMDALLLVSDAQAFTGANQVSTNTVDTGAVDVEIGTGDSIGFGLSVDVAADHTTGDETYAFDVVEDDDPALGSTRIIAHYVLLYSELTAGKKAWLPIPMGFPKLRYIGVQAAFGGTTPLLTATIALTKQSLFSLEPKSYPIGYTV